MRKKSIVLLCAALALLAFSGDAPGTALLAPMDMPVAKLLRTGEQSVQLAMEPLLQNPALPNGCEATSLTAVLHFYGYAGADNISIAAQYIPHEEITYSADGMTTYGPDPAEAYAGCPAPDTTGYYCLSGPIVQAANAYLEEQGAALQAANISGAPESALVRQLDAGCPVIVWATIGFEPVQYGEFQWQLPDGSLYTPYINLHCMVLTGFDEDTFYIMDPLGENTRVARDVFMARYRDLGMQAVVIGPADLAG